MFGQTLVMAGFDIIGDVHGHVDRLRGLLTLLGYTEERGVWSHPERTAVFVGDLIDRGPGQLDTLRMVQAMVEAGSAQIVLGNHEFNGVAYATFDPVRGDYCRPHSDKNTGQHDAFLLDVEFGSPLHRSIIDWFMTIPMWLDLGGVRVVHACWSPPRIAHLKNWSGPNNTLTERIVIDGTTKGTATYEAIETVLKGPEVHLNGVRYEDKDGHRREHARLRWWDSGATTLRTAALIPPGTQLYDAGDRRSTNSWTARYATTRCSRTPGRSRCCSATTGGARNRPKRSTRWRRASITASPRMVCFGRIAGTARTRSTPQSSLMCERPVTDQSPSTRPTRRPTETVRGHAKPSHAEGRWRDPSET